ncbi:MAG TPA: hypothetical protein VF272_04435 [Candidatus Saccharimonadia bacterium]
MQCPKCGKTGFVAINGKRFCSNCGATVVAGTAPSSMSEITSATSTLDLRSDPAVQAAPQAPKPLPAGQLHGRQIAGAALRDLRPAPSVPPNPPSPATASSSYEAVAAPTPTPAPQSPAPAAAQVMPPSPAADTRSPLIQKLPPHPALARPEPNPLPNAVKANVGSLAATTPAPVPTPESSDLQQALKAAKSSTTVPMVTKVAAAIATIGVMSGLIWLQNAPKLAFHNAAAKAGIDASLPTYIPSSYRQIGPTNTSNGRISINFTNASSETPLSIVQRRTNWDSNSLRENYVSRQTANFLAVQGQGLVIYLDDDQANWVNHGIWYQIIGTSKLGREQVLKIAYGL